MRIVNGVAGRWMVGLLWVMAMTIGVGGRAAIADDHGDNCASATEVALGAGQSTTVLGETTDPADQDWLRVPTTPGHLYRITFRPVTPYRLALQVYAADCTTVLHNYWGADGPLVFGVQATETSMYVVVLSDGFSERLTYDVQVEARGRVTDDFPPGTSPEIGLDADWSYGRIDHADDTDTFRLSASPQDWLRIEMQVLTAGGGVQGVIRSGTDWLASESASGNAGAGAGSVSAINLVVPTNVGAPLDVVIGRAGGVETIGYRVRAVRVGSLAGPDDHAGECVDATSLVVGAPPVLVRMPVGDEDWLSFPTLAGHLYELHAFAVVGDYYVVRGNIGESCDTASTFDLQITGPPFQRVATSFRAQSTGTAHVRVFGAPAFDDAAVVELSVTDSGAVPDDYGAGPEGAGTLVVGGSPTFCMGDYTGDVDAFAVNLAPMRRYRVELLGNEYNGVAMQRPDGRVRHLAINRPAAPTGQWPGGDIICGPAGAGTDGTWLIRVSPELYSVVLIRIHDLGSLDQAASSPACAGAPARPLGPVDLVIFPGDEQRWAGFDVLAGRRYRAIRHDATTNNVATRMLWNCQYSFPGFTGSMGFGDVEFEPPADGRIELGASVYDEWEAALVRVELRDVGPATDLIGDDDATALSVDAGSMIQLGRIDHPWDRDRFRVRLRPGANYRLEVQSESRLTAELAIGAQDASIPVTRVQSSWISSTDPTEWAAVEFTSGGSPDHWLLSGSSEWRATQGNFRFRLSNADCRADWNDDGALTVGDLFGFLAAWLAGDGTGEYDGYGAQPATLEDLFAYLNDFLRGCS